LGSPTAKDKSRKDFLAAHQGCHASILPAGTGTTHWKTSAASKSTYSGKIAMVAMSYDPRLS
jgi:hypothetical protein